MSAVADFVKDAGPIAIGIGGLLVAYANSRQPGREARHHARVETLYQDMLNLLEHRFNNGKRSHGIGEIDPLPTPAPEAFMVTSARLTLYASPAVREAWAQAYTLTGAFERASSPDDDPSFAKGAWGGMDARFQQLFSVDKAIEQLADRMRADLGVPRASLLMRLARIKRRVDGRRRLRKGRKTRRAKPVGGGPVKR